MRRNRFLFLAWLGVVLAAEFRGELAEMDHPRRRADEPVAATTDDEHDVLFEPLAGPVLPKMSRRLQLLHKC